MVCAPGVSRRLDGLGFAIYGDAVCAGEWEDGEHACATCPAPRGCP